MGRHTQNRTYYAMSNVENLDTIYCPAFLGNIINYLNILLMNRAIY